MTLSAGVKRAIFIDKTFIVKGEGLPVLVSELVQGTWITGSYSVCKINGPSELVVDLFGKGAHHTVHLVTTAELEVE